MIKAIVVCKDGKQRTFRDLTTVDMDLVAKEVMSGHGFMIASGGILGSYAPGSVDRVIFEDQQ